MPKVDDETLRQRFLKAKEAWDERQKNNRARQRREKARADARCKTLIGKMVPDHFRLIRTNATDSWLDWTPFSTTPRDRTLFNLPAGLNTQ